MALAEPADAMTNSGPPVVSICVANYNGRALLETCIQSIFEQTAQIDVEIIVHDDASSDDSLRWLHERCPGVRVIASRENVGFCIGNNRMAQVARGEYLLLLNNDAALLPDALSSLLEMARRSPPGTILTLPQFDWDSGEPVDRGCYLDPFYNPVPKVTVDDGDVAMCIGACLWISRDRWFELGGFPQWMESIGEDLYLCCVNRLTGGAVRCTASSGYRHRQGASFGGNRGTAQGLQTTIRRRKLSERNKTAVLFICTPGWLMPLLLALHIASLAVEGAALSLAKRNKELWVRVYAPAIWSPIRYRQLWCQLRRSIQPRRAVGTSMYFAPFVATLRKLELLRKFGVPTIQS